jgi:hypothetical protein
MNKTLRIVAKDARHLWPEILVSLAITAGFIATDHFGWPQYGNEPFHEAGTLRVWMQILLPITWWLLVSRAVHDESLVGDRQFWITRPYGWPRVLAAKLIFIASFILLPYLLAQCILMEEAHLHPLNVLPGLAFTLATIFVLFLLPLFALATVTSTISRIFIIFFGLAVYTGLAFYFGSAFGTPPSWNPGSEPPYLNVAILIALFIPAVVILVQYAQRRTGFSVALLLALVAIITAGGVANYYAHHRIQDFPAVSASEAAPFSVSLDPDPRHIFPPRTDAQLQAESPQTNEMPINIPITISGIAPNHAVRVEAETMTVSADGHPSVTIPWNSHAGNLMFAPPPQSGLSRPLLGDSQQNAELPRWVYRDFGNRKITLHLTYAVLELEAESPTRIPFNAEAADVPEHGRCIENSHSQTKNAGITCQYALTGPSLTHVTWNLNEACNPLSGKPLADEQWIGDSNGSRREAQLSPVVPLMWGFATEAGPFKDPRTYKLCNGSPFTFTKYHIWRRRMIEVTLPPIDPTIYIPPPIHQSNSADIPPPDSE